MFIFTIKRNLSQRYQTIIITNGKLKLIDFGESKDYFFDLDNEAKNIYTIGTPQYLSPILWKAHVIDGNSRYVEHNIYQTDIFSTGLDMYQMSAMQEVIEIEQYLIK